MVLFIGIFMSTSCLLLLLSISISSVYGFLYSLLVIVLFNRIITVC